MDLKTIADRTISGALGKSTLVKSKFITSDIISQILDVDKVAFKNVQQFVKEIRFSSLQDLSRQLHDFIRNNITYIEDPSGDQYIKTPSAIWRDKVADCKGYSIFISACLKALKVPYSFRFVSFSDQPRYTHVYVISHGKNSDYIIDACLPEFNTEKKYTYKKDFYMAGLYKIEGIGHKVGALNLPDDIENVTVAQMDARIIRQRLETEKQILDKLHGIGSLKARKYQNSIDVMHQFINALDTDNHQRAEEIINGLAPGIGKITLKKILKGASKAVTKIVDKGKKVVTKAAKAVVKVVTAPARLAAKGVLEVSLPKMAPLFLYLFINDQKIIDKLPDNIRAKRKKAEKLADFIVNGIGMKRNHFMGIVRNGIMKQYSKSPEQVIAKMLKDKGINGIGIVPLVMALLPVAKKVIETIVKLFGGKNAPIVEATDFPEDQDFSVLPNELSDSLTKDVLSQKDNISPGDSLDSSIPDSGGRKLFGIC